MVTSLRLRKVYRVVREENGSFSVEVVQVTPNAKLSFGEYVGHTDASAVCKLLNAANERSKSYNIPFEEAMSQVVEMYETRKGKRLE